MKLYQCYIKSHIDAPDFDVEFEAKNKTEAINILYKRFLDFSKEELKDYVWEVK